MRYFITYGDQNYAESRERLLDEATGLRYFDKVIAYNKEDLPTQVLKSPLLKFSRGGGYWLWKPYIISETLKIMNEEDVLVYADAGCSVFKNNEWEKYFKYLRKYNMLAFLLNVTVEQYTRKNILLSFTENGKYWVKKYQISATFLMMKKTDEVVDLIDSWLNFMLENPECVVDVNLTDLKNENPSFIENRHDQSVFTAIAYKYYKAYKIKFLQNHFEGGVDKLRSRALIASRISDENTRGQNRPFIKSILLFCIVEPLRYLRQKYWTMRTDFYDRSLR